MKPDMIIRESLSAHLKGVACDIRHLIHYGQDGRGSVSFEAYVPGAHNRPEIAFLIDRQVGYDTERELREIADMAGEALWDMYSRYFIRAARGAY